MFIEVDRAYNSYIRSARVHAMYISLYFIKYILLSTYLASVQRSSMKKLGLVEIVNKFTSEIQPNPEINILTSLVVRKRGNDY